MNWSLLASLLSFTLCQPPVCARPEAQDRSEATASGAARRLTVGEWRDDLAYFARELEARHANLYHTISRDRFLAEVAALDARLPDVREEARLLEFARLGALIGDGHTGVFLSSNRLFPNADAKSLSAFPLEFWYDDDRVVVLAAGLGYEPGEPFGVWRSKYTVLDSSFADGERGVRSGQLVGHRPRRPGGGIREVCRLNSRLAVRTRTATTHS